MSNQNPEQKARDHIDKQLTACGWIIQSIKQVNLNAGIGVAVKEYLTDVGPADYVLFVEGKPWRSYRVRSLILLSITRQNTICISNIYRLSCVTS